MNQIQFALVSSKMQHILFFLKIKRMSAWSEAILAKMESKHIARYSVNTLGRSDILRFLGI